MRVKHDFVEAEFFTRVAAALEIDQECSLTLGDAHVLRESLSVLHTSAVDAVRWVGCVELASRGFGSPQLACWSSPAAAIEVSGLFGHIAPRCVGVREAVQEALCTVGERLRPETHRGSGQIGDPSLAVEFPKKSLLQSPPLDQLWADLAEVRRLEKEWAARLVLRRPPLRALRSEIHTASALACWARSRIEVALEAELAPAGHSRACTTSSAPWAASIQAVSEECVAALEASRRGATDPGVAERISAACGLVAEARAHVAATVPSFAAPGVPVPSADWQGTVDRTELLEGFASSAGEKQRAAPRLSDDVPGRGLERSEQQRREYLDELQRALSALALPPERRPATP